MNDRLRRSALWAAYGDALGFISERVGEKWLKQRLGAHSNLSTTVAWKRRVGGRFGATVNLPAGCYSDDTQLRLATARCIRSDGHFDVEAFAKVELPVWRSYALGAGLGTMAAALNLSRSSVNWFSNFYSDRRSDYFRSGGNGAAMRIQPHVWAARQNDDRVDTILSMCRNTICTHGHPRGILGALFHGLTVLTALERHVIPGPEEWLKIVEELRSLPELLRNDKELGSLWLRVWEYRKGESFMAAVGVVIDELLRDIELLTTDHGEGSQKNHLNAVDALSARDAKERGSGTKTALLASHLAWLNKSTMTPAAALETAASTLNSDTDSIATMAGAILGLAAAQEPRQEIQDRAYIERDIDRLDEISQKKTVRDFSYPDLITWVPPATQLDALGLWEGQKALAGLGMLEPIGSPAEGQSKDKPHWQWFRLDFGQSIVAKHRETLQPLVSGALPVQKSDIPVKSVKNRRHSARTGSLFSPQPLVSSTKAVRPEQAQNLLNELTQEAIRSDFDERIVGRNLLAASRVSIENAIAYAAIIAKAKLVRHQKTSG